MEDTPSVGLVWWYVSHLPGIPSQVPWPVKRSPLKYTTAPWPWVSTDLNTSSNYELTQLNNRLYIATLTFTSLPLSSPGTHQLGTSWTVLSTYNYLHGTRLSKDHYFWPHIVPYSTSLELLSLLLHRWYGKTALLHRHELRSLPPYCYTTWWPIQPPHTWCLFSLSNVRLFSVLYLCNLLS